MNDSVSTLRQTITGAEDDAPTLAPQGHPLRLEFTGSGSEYFRIWIVNLLLMLLTLGIYYPWAKVRRLRYFHGNTLIDGEPLGFHADPKKMLKGYLLVGLLFGLYSVAGNFSAMAGFVAFLIVMAIWPALLKSSMQFRLANTSWRGLRFRFKGSVGGSYKALVPLFLPSLVIVGALTAVADRDKPPVWYLITVFGVMLVTLTVIPWLLWNLKQYQHNHYALASLQTTFKATLGSFYKVLFKTLGVMLAAMVPAVVLAIVLSVAITYLGQGSGTHGRFAAAAAIGGALGMFAGMAAMFVVAKPYLTSRLQNLVWSRTGNGSLRFLSDLRFRPLFWLTLKNWLLIILTLGLYWPFATVALARLRLEAVTVKTRISLDTLVNLVKSLEGDAAGDAAGDLFGLDIGL